MEEFEGADGPPGDRSVANEFAYFTQRAAAHERLVAGATDDVPRAIHLRFQRLYQEQAEKLRRVDNDHLWAQEY